MQHLCCSDRHISFVCVERAAQRRYCESRQRCLAYPPRSHEVYYRGRAEFTVA